MPGVSDYDFALYDLIVAVVECKVCWRMVALKSPDGSSFWLDTAPKFKASDSHVTRHVASNAVTTSAMPQSVSRQAWIAGLRSRSLIHWISIFKSAFKLEWSLYGQLLCFNLQFDLVPSFNTSRSSILVFGSLVSVL